MFRKFICFISLLLILQYGYNNVFITMPDKNT